MRKTKVLGFSMETRSARRLLIVAVYAILAALLAAGWFLDQLHVTGPWLYYAAFFVGYFILGGVGPYGLIKPFTGKGPRNQPMPSCLVELQLAVTGAIEPASPSLYRNDERELQLRDRAHYRAYQVVLMLFAPIWLLSLWTPHLISPALLPHLVLLLATAGVILSITLPQALILWTEPDMYPEPAAADD